MDCCSVARKERKRRKTCTMKNDLTNLFFLVGCPRSGTTLLQQALNRHSKIAIPPETAFFTFLGLRRKGQQDHLRRINADLHINVSFLARRVYNHRDGRALYEKMAQLYLERLDKADVTHFGEKSPEHQRRLCLIRRVFSDAKIMLIYRDGRDVACSVRKLPWMSSDLYVNFALWLHYYRIQRREQSRQDPNLLCVKYEDLVRHPEPEMRRVLEFLGLPYESQVVSGSGNSEGVPGWETPWKARALEPISSARIGTWRAELSSEQVAILERWGGKALMALGYEMVSDGKARLPWYFAAKVYAKALWWVARRPRYGSFRGSEGARCPRSDKAPMNAE
jgi:hypothetical protein